MRLTGWVTFRSISIPLSGWECASSMRDLFVGTPIAGSNLRIYFITNQFSLAIYEVVGWPPIERLHPGREPFDKHGSCNFLNSIDFYRLIC